MPVKRAWWWQWGDEPPLIERSCQVDDVALVQPVGFVWFTKPRYRVKAVTRRV